MRAITRRCYGCGSPELAVNNECVRCGVSLEDHSAIVDRKVITGSHTAGNQTSNFMAPVQHNTMNLSLVADIRDAFNDDDEEEEEVITYAPAKPDGMPWWRIALNVIFATTCILSILIMVLMIATMVSLLYLNFHA